MPAVAPANPISAPAPTPEPPRPLLAGARATFRALRHRNFRLFWFGQLISLIGTWMQGAAQWWLVHRLTSEPIWLGIVGAAAFLPVFLFSFLAGVVADRVPKRRLLVATQFSAMTLALVLSALTFSDVVTVYHVAVIAFCLGIVNAFDMPARQAFVIEMVGEDDLFNAIALNSSVFNAARVVGPAVAGLVIAATGEAVCFLVNGLSFLPVIAGLLAMRLEKPRARPHRPVLHELSEGFSFVLRTVRVRAVLLAVAISSIFGMSFTILLPVFADEILHQGARGYGLLMGAFGVGAVTSALRLAARSSTRGSARLITIGLGLFGTSLILLSFSRVFALSLVILVLTGGAMITQLATTNTYLQRVSPDAIRGRVLSIYSFTLVGVAPIGSFLAGFVAQHFGAPWSVRLGGIACLVGAGWFASRIPAL
ncbi:MAG: MFS transporter, partial [Candidatus Eisenbacteria bacterium]|nr:MFS transporter [Candidatus Eisenbacteria bacterium]